MLEVWNILAVADHKVVSFQNMNKWEQSAYKLSEAFKSFSFSAATSSLQSPAALADMLQIHANYQN